MVGQRVRPDGICDTQAPGCPPTAPGGATDGSLRTIDGPTVP